ncbi:hypothetical protein B0H13DRAFT_2556913, partial [Mycena leptocephala]
CPRITTSTACSLIPPPAPAARCSPLTSSRARATATTCQQIESTSVGISIPMAMGRCTLCVFSLFSTLLKGRTHRAAPDSRTTPLPALARPPPLTVPDLTHTRITTTPCPPTPLQPRPRASPLRRASAPQRHGRPRAPRPRLAPVRLRTSAIMGRRSPSPTHNMNPDTMMGTGISTVQSWPYSRSYSSSYFSSYLLFL